MNEITYVAIEDLDFSFSDKNRLEYIRISLYYEQGDERKYFDLSIKSPQKITEFIDYIPLEAFSIEGYEVVKPKKGYCRSTRDLTIEEFMEIYSTIAFGSFSDVCSMEQKHVISAHKYLYDYLATPLIEAYPDNSRLEEL